MKKRFLLIAVCLILLATNVFPQSRRRSTRTSRAQAARTQAAAERTAAEFLAARQKISAQIKTLSQFLYVYGGVVKGVESLNDVEKEPPSPRAAEQNERNKARIRESIKNVRDSLVALEADFKTKPSLYLYYVSVAGAARLGDDAMNQASANRFNEAGRSLVTAIGRLSDTLVNMR